MRHDRSQEESYRDSESKKSSRESETAVGPERDLLDIVPASLEKYPRLSYSIAHLPRRRNSNEYFVSLQSRQLGMTVENVLERTIVRSVYPNSEAFRLNVRPNSLILSIGASRF